MNEYPQASGPVFTDDHLINLYYIQELYGNIAEFVSRKMRDEHVHILGIGCKRLLA